MIVVKVKVGSRGQIVIPKILRDNFGIFENSEVLIEADEDGIRIKPVRTDIVERWEEIARKEGVDVKKDLLYGDKLYEEIF